MTTINTVPRKSTERLPKAALLALAMTGFLTFLTETIPAGMLLQISEDMDISEALAGQFVTFYAIGALIAAIPLTTMTQSWPRKHLLLFAVVVTLLFNILTALTPNYVVALIARFLAGMAGGLIWGMLAGYARRMVDDHLKGRALAIAGFGVPLALSLGVPLGTLLGTILGWRTTFGVISILTLVIIIWILIKVPNYSGQETRKQIPLLKVFMTPGIHSILAILIFWVLAHSILYTYIIPFLTLSNLTERADLVLLIFGITSLGGIWLSAVLIDRMLRSLILLSLFGFALASLALGIAGSIPIVVYLAIGTWGFTFGGAAALLQTASANAAGDGADVAQSILVTIWNLAIAAGGIIGGILLETAGLGIFPWALLVLLLISLFIAWKSNKYGLPINKIGE